MKRITAMRPAIAAFVVTSLPLWRNVFDKLVGERGTLAGYAGQRSSRNIPTEDVHSAGSARDS